MSRRHPASLPILLAPLLFTAPIPSFADEAAIAHWGTYYGDDWSRSVVALAPLSDGVAMTLGRFGDEQSGDEALVYFDAAGALQWRAFHGANNGEGVVEALASVPELDLIYMVGSTTYDAGIATPGAHQTQRECFGFDACGREAFIAQFGPTGGLRWGTYFGGPFNDYIYGAAAVPTGELYVCGKTESATGVATPGAYETVLNGDVGGFLAKFGPDGVLLWSTYLDEQCFSVAADHGGAGVVVSAGSEIARFSAAGQPEWFTSIGADAVFSHELEFDANSAVYRVSGTSSPDLPVSPDAHQDSYGGDGDLYIVMLTPSGEQMWATYFGGDSAELRPQAALDRSGDLYFSTTTYSEGLATMGDPSSTVGETGDAILGKFSQDGTLAWAIYYGGEDSDHARALTVDPDGRIYLGGQTRSTAGIATPSAHRTEPRDYQSAFLAMFRAD